MAGGRVHTVRQGQGRRASLLGLSASPGEEGSRSPRQVLGPEVGGGLALSWSRGPHAFTTAAVAQAKSPRHDSSPDEGPGPGGT